LRATAFHSAASCPSFVNIALITGDGEPDRDFPALGAEKLLSDFNLDEYCICAVEGRKRAATGTSAGPRGTAQTTTDTLSPPMPHVISGLSGIGGIRQSVSAGALSLGGLSGMGGSSSKNRDRDDTVDTVSNRQGRARSSSKQSYDSFENSVSISSWTLPLWSVLRMYACMILVPRRLTAFAQFCFFAA
jgi:hypothetical protein